MDYIIGSTKLFIVVEFILLFFFVFGRDRVWRLAPLTVALMLFALAIKEQTINVAYSNSLLVFSALVLFLALGLFKTMYHATRDELFELRDPYNQWLYDFFRTFSRM